MSSNILNNAHVVGIGTRNLVLNTLGRVYVKVKDRYYELNFKGQSIQEGGTQDPDIIIIDSNSDLDDMTYPGDGKIIITKNGYVYYTADGEYNLIRFQNFGDSLELDELIINGQIIINTGGNIPPFIIDSSILVENLNAQYLNGYTSDRFAIKDLSEFISGNWTFTNNVQVYDQISNSNQNPDNPTTLDFLNSTLTIDNIVVRGDIIWDGWPDPGETSSETIFAVNGVPNETWIGQEYFIESTSSTELDNVLLNQISTWYEDEILSNAVELEIWFNVFITNYDAILAADDAGTDIVYEIKRNLLDPAEQAYVISYLQANGISTVNYNELLLMYYRLYDFALGTDYQGSVQTVSLTSDEFTIYANTIVKYGVGDVNKAIVIAVDGSLLTVLNYERLTSITEGMKIVIVDNALYPLKQGSVVFNSSSNFQNFIDVVSSHNYNIEELPEDDEDSDEFFYTGLELRLLDNNNVRARLGRLDGLADDPIYGTLTGIGLYVNGNAFIKNANLDSVTITNSTIDQLTFDDSNLSAGGDLDGTYPNPTIKDGVVTPVKLDRAYLELAGGTMSGTINTQALIPVANNTYSLGNTANRYNAYLQNTYLYANIRPASANNTVTIGESGYNFANIFVSAITLGGVNKTNEINSIVISGDGTKFLGDNGTYYPINVDVINKDLGVTTLASTALNLSTDITTGLTPVAGDCYIKSYTHDSNAAVTVTASGNIYASQGGKDMNYITQNSATLITIEAGETGSYKVISVIAKYTGSVWNFRVNVEYYTTT